MTDDPWPKVFRQPLDASYNPGVPAMQRRGMAIADGLDAWAKCMAAKYIGTTIPENFGLVIIKLQEEAGIAGVSDEDFLVAQKAWLLERRMANPDAQ